MASPAPASASGAPAPVPPRRGAPGLALLAALALLAGAAVYWLQPAPPPAPAGAAAPAVSRRSLAVLGFQNRGGVASQEWVGTALSEAMAAGLAAGGRLRLVPAESVARVRAELSIGDVERQAGPSLERIAKNLAADLLVTGGYDVAGAENEVHLELHLREAAGGRVLAAFAESGNTRGLVSLAGRAEARLRHALGLGGAPEGAEEVAQVLPAHPDAARLYAEGLARLRVFDAIGARDRLEEAALVEPEHPLVHIALAEAWAMLGHESRAKSETRKAFASSSHLPLAERLGLEARHRERIGEREKAVEVWRTLASFYPESVDYGLQLAQAQSAAGQRQPAMDTIDRLRRLPAPLSQDPRLDLEEARSANALADYRRGAAAAARAAQKGQEQGARLLVARAHLLESFALRSLGEPARAVAAARAARELYTAAGDRFGAARAMLEMASTLRYRGDLAESRKLAQEALALSQEVGDKATAARALNRVAGIVAEQGQLGEARRLYEQALAAFRELDDKSGEATALNNIGETLWKQGDLEAARRRLDEALALFQGIKSRRGLCFAQFNLGYVLTDQGDFAAARTNLQQSVEQAREIQEKSLSAAALQGLGRVDLLQGDLSAARAHLQESLDLRRELGERSRMAESRLGLAQVALAEGRAAEAEALAREAAGEYRAEKLVQGEAMAEVVMASALAAGHRRPAGAEAAGRALALAQESEYEAVRLHAILARARLETAGPRLGDALGRARDAAAAAARRGNLPLELEARLVEAELLKKSGQAEPAERAFAAVEAAATRRGALLHAHLAAARRAGPAS